MKIILDTNAVVHYILNDIPEQTKIIENTINNYRVLILPEVVYESIHIFCKFYDFPRADVAKSLIEFLEDNGNNNAYLEKALHVFRDTQFDFIDCMLFAYSHDFKVLTFDKKLNSLISRGSI
ncbi:hypothetical protein AGMMS49975_18060 [Clostridia bacterium]|nr:hypothetical protein AGMMS49975_18060 [Clostridia bacterium]GHU74956.1 hypothetical protein FACS1894188_04760 [Clostridia bacterium]